MDDPAHRFADLAATAPHGPLFAELHRLCDALVGVVLFTCSRFDLAAGTAERIYTNDEDAYPLTGLKEIVRNRWTGIVLEGRQPFLARSADELEDVFPDHEKIAQLGLGATINLPIFLSGTFLGTVNLLHKNGHYGSATLNALRPAHLPAIVAFQSYLMAQAA